MRNPGERIPTPDDVERARALVHDAIGPLRDLQAMSKQWLPVLDHNGANICSHVSVAANQAHDGLMFAVKCLDKITRAQAVTL